MIEIVLIAINIFLVEAMLSIDNVAVLALMVRALPANQQKKALRYGIWGAFLMRGLSLFIATWISRFFIIKIIGGGYLLYLSYQHFFNKASDGDNEIKSAGSFIKNLLGAFWSTVLLVELMDMTFSIDNIFAATALSNNVYLVLFGVFAGIIAMRFVAGWFIQLIDKYPTLENSAFVVIALLGIKLVITGSFQNIKDVEEINIFLTGNGTTVCFSLLLLLVFLYPLLIFKSEAKTA